MLMRCVAFVGLFVLTTSALASATPPPAAPAAGAAIKADTPKATSAGTQFMVPADWTLHASGNKVTLNPPEAGSQAVLVDVKAATPDDAVAQAWKAYAPTKTWPLQVASDVAPRDDWDQIRVYNYEPTTSAASPPSPIAMASNTRC